MKYKIFISKKHKYIPASHENYDDPGVYKKILMNYFDFPSGIKIQMINWARMPKGKGFRSHFHEDMDEIFIILNGKVKISINNIDESLGKGDMIYVPMRNIHQMDNACKTEVNYIVIGLSRGKNGKTINA